MSKYKQDILNKLRIKNCVQYNLDIFLLVMAGCIMISIVFTILIQLSLSYFILY